MVVEQGKEIKQKQDHLTGVCLALSHCAIISQVSQAQQGKGLINTAHSRH